jgi:hypothetical protein
VEFPDDGILRQDRRDHLIGALKDDALIEAKLGDTFLDIIEGSMSFLLTLVLKSFWIPLVYQYLYRADINSAIVQIVF